MFTFVLLLQAFKGKVKDYLQRRYLEQINENQTRKDTFVKCRSDDLNDRCLKRESSSGLVQSFEHISKPEHHHHHTHSNSSSISPTTHKSDITGKAHSFDSSSVLLQHSVSDTNLCCALSASDTNFIQSSTGNIVRSQSKRGLLQRCATIDMEDTPALNNDDEQMTSSPTSPIRDEKADGGKITFSIDRPDDENEEEEDDDDVDETKSISIQSNNNQERKSRAFRYSYSDQQTTDEHSRNYLLPYRHSFEQHHDKRTLSSVLTTMPFTTGIPVPPLAPYSAQSDPGPYHSPWSHTPTNPYGLVNFHFPKSQEHLVNSAQGSIAQLSTLTKILCDEPSVFTPISPR
jgi:hypothetical protein